MEENNETLATEERESHTNLTQGWAHNEKRDGGHGLLKRIYIGKLITIHFHNRYSITLNSRIQI